MTDARHAGIHWIGLAGRHGGRAKALLVALPLLLLSLLIDHGIVGPAEHRGGIAASAGQASDMAGAEGKLQLAARAGVAADPLRAKPKLSGDGQDSNGLALSASLVSPGLSATTSPGAAAISPAASRPFAARPRAPPAIA